MLFDFANHMLDCALCGKGSQKLCFTLSLYHSQKSVFRTKRHHLALSELVQSRKILKMKSVLKVIVIRVQNCSFEGPSVVYRKTNLIFFQKIWFNDDFELSRKVLHCNSLPSLSPPPPKLRFSYSFFYTPEISGGMR